MLKIIGLVFVSFLSFNEAIELNNSFSSKWSLLQFKGNVLFFVYSFGTNTISIVYMFIVHAYHSNRNVLMWTFFIYIKKIVIRNLLLL